MQKILFLKTVPVRLLAATNHTIMRRHLLLNSAKPIPQRYGHYSLKIHTTPDYGDEFNAAVIFMRRKSLHLIGL